MPKPTKFTYQKKEPFRDAFYLIIVCEGSNREPEYFRFFDGLSSRVKVVPVESHEGESAPEKLIDNARRKIEELDATSDCDSLWFVIDTDRWRAQVHHLRSECEHHHGWNVAQSNPCFEVWLYYHVKNTLPALAHIDRCNNWKPYLAKIIKGGFNPDFHPVAIETATGNAKGNYREEGYLPEPGSTQLWQLAEVLMPLIKSELEALKQKFPAPIATE
jgi:hypothetical protein